jgi:hypothetical protein
MGFLTRSGNVLRERVEVKYRMIDRCRDAFRIRLMCRCLRVSASGPGPGLDCLFGAYLTERYLSDVAITQLIWSDRCQHLDPTWRRLGWCHRLRRCGLAQLLD